MRVRAAVLAALTRSQLRKAVERAGISGVDVADQGAMALALNQDGRAKATMLLEYLPPSRLPEVLMFLGLPPTTMLEQLSALAAEEDASAARPDGEVATPRDAAAMEEPIPPRLHRTVGRGWLVSWEPHDLLGVVDKIEPRRVVVRFDDGETRYFAIESPPLRRVQFTPGIAVMRQDGSMGIIQREVPGQDVPTWQVWFGPGTASVAEMALRPAVLVDPVERMRVGDLGSAKDFNLRSVAMDYWTEHRNNELVSLANARVDLKPYQVSVAHRVVSGYPHRFLLCDEVGLGKTIEAAMIIKELRARGQARRVLILVPSGLLRQWQFELKSKFNESFAIYNKNTVQLLRDQGEANPWSASDSVIASHAWASWTDERRREIAAVDWDLVIVDEAHHARVHKYGNSITRTNLFRLVDALIADREFLRRGALLLTATPMQLDRYELYSLVDMLDPVLFASERDFSQHLSSLAGLNKLVERLLANGPPSGGADREEFVEEVAQFLEIGAKEAEDLVRTDTRDNLATRLRDRHRLSEVMVRNRKALVGAFQPRVAVRWEVELSPEEERVQKIMQEVFEEGWRLREETNQNAIGFLMVILQKLLASSSRALLTSLKKRRSRLSDPAPTTIEEDEAEEELEDDEEASVVTSEIAPRVDGSIGRFDEVIELLEQIYMDSKTRVLVENLTELFASSPDEKVLIFAEFRETQDMLAERLSEQWSVHKFHGQLSPEQKDGAVDAFRRGHGPEILVSTEAGGEGRNFQFCHVLVNYDLPWNPMKVEQRIGRLDRIGQEHPISIFNFHVQGTIEGRILEVLERRIRVFEESVGSLDPILGDAETDIRKALRLAQEARDARIEEIGRRLEQDIRQAKQAERELGDFIMDAKSYKAEVVQTATGASAPIDANDFELFLEQLLAWAHTYIGPQTETGERLVEFHAPFTVEHPELFGGLDRRRVCLDSGLAVDSELVEYLGFGHPIVDALVRRVTEEKPDGAAALRRIPIGTAVTDRPGWQFDWLVTVSGLRSTEFMYPVFVDDSGGVDAKAGRALLLLSRRFLPEGSKDPADVSGLDEAHRVALEAVGRVKEQAMEAARVEANERASVVEVRVEALAAQRVRAAEDRIRSCESTLGRVRSSEERQVQQAASLWEANLARAQAELVSIREDREAALADIRRRRNPNAEFTLVNVARIEVL